MTPYFTDDHLTVHIGDCRAVMAEMPAESVHCVVTSPPYWGLRDYGTATWEGGDAECDHRVGGQVAQTKHPAEGHATGQRPGVDAWWCVACGARRIDAQLGLEPTPEAYVANMVDVFREVRRVLRDDGTAWLNLGDSYTSGGRTTQVTDTARRGQVVDGKRLGPGRRDLDGDAASGKQEYLNGTARPPVIDHIGPKNLVGIPWRVAFALQADGWYLRSDIIWSKPNPMPESVTDRPTKAHEYLFLLAKSPRYYFDAEAVREDGEGYGRSVWEKPQFKSGDITRHHGNGDGHGTGAPTMQGGRNIRSVWTITTQPYPGAHFATFPEKLVEPCVKAGCPSEGVVLDPFAGSGTVGRVANRLGRRAVLIDLSADYIDQAMLRNAQAPLGLGA